MKQVKQNIRNLDPQSFNKLRAWCRRHRIDMNECQDILFEDDLETAHFKMFVRDTAHHKALRPKVVGNGYEAATMTVDRTVFEPFPFPDYIIPLPA